MLYPVFDGIVELHNLVNLLFLGRGIHRRRLNHSVRISLGREFWSHAVLAPYFNIVVVRAEPWIVGRKFGNINRGVARVSISGGCAFGNTCEPRVPYFVKVGDKGVLYKVCGILELRAKAEPGGGYVLLGELGGVFPRIRPAKSHLACVSENNVC